MSEPVTWLDVLILMAAYIVASLLYKAICSMLAARDTLRELDPETGDEAAPERQDGDSADPSRAVCNDPVASSPLAEWDRERADRWRP